MRILVSFSSGFFFWFSFIIGIARVFFRSVCTDYGYFGMLNCLYIMVIVSVIIFINILGVFLVFCNLGGNVLDFYELIDFCCSIH